MSSLGVSICNRWLNYVSDLMNSDALDVVEVDFLDVERVGVVVERSHLWQRELLRHGHRDLDLEVVVELDVALRRERRVFAPAELVLVSEEQTAAAHLRNLNQVGVVERNFSGLEQIAFEVDCAGLSQRDWNVSRSTDFDFSELVDTDCLFV